MTTTPGEPTGAVAKTWKPMTAGILTLISGIILLIAGIAFAVLGDIIGAFAGMWGLGGIIGGPAIALGIVSIVGGIFALQRRIWGLALAGAICAIPLIFVMGILSIIFLALSKDEFAKS